MDGLVIKTVDDVRAVLERIKAQLPDNEGAHGMEDTLYFAVLTAIAEGAPDAPALAREALKADEIKFERWCA